MLTDEERNVALDSLALVAAAHRGLHAEALQMLGTFTTDAEKDMLIAALTGNCVALLRVCAELGLDPDKALGAVIAYARDHA